MTPTIRTATWLLLATLTGSVVNGSAAEPSEEVLKLAAQLKDPKESNRLKALKELQALREKAIPVSAAISEAMLDSSADVRTAAAECLEKTAPKIYKPIVAILYDVSAKEKRKAVLELANLGAEAKGAVPVLKSHYFKMLKQDKILEYSTLQAICKIAPDDPQAVAEVLLLTSSPREQVTVFDSERPNAVGNARMKPRMAGLALINLINAPNEKKVAALIPGLDEPAYRELVCERLAKFGTDAKPAIPALMKLKLDGVASVREAASKAIKAINGE